MKISLNISITPQDKAMLQKQADVEGVSKSQHIARLVRAEEKRRNNRK